MPDCCSQSYKRTVDRRLESTVGGRVLVSIGLLVVLGGVITWNLPTSELARRTQPVFRRFMLSAGLDQYWAVFSPDPPSAEVELQARVAYDDGTERLWTVPRGGTVVGPYWDYRWLKWGEIVSAGNDAKLWRPAAEWIARQEEGAGRHPVTVTLRRHIVPLPLGAPPGDPVPVDFFVLPVGPGFGGQAP